jgi:cobyrinic acid a,c-diamide synthase
MINTPRLVVAAPRGRSGKTVLSVGLCAAFAEQYVAVQPFKRGPDYIDASWLTAVSPHPCRNLDVFLMGESGVQNAFRRTVAATAPDLAIIEGAMGIFDGMGPEGRGSAAHVARLLQAPILLIMNASRMTRSVAPVIRGLQTFEEGTHIGGVVFNHVNHARHLKKMRAAVERHCGIPVLGALPDEPAATVPQRHLGLVPQQEDESLSSFTEAAKQLVAKNVDLGGVLVLAQAAPPLAAPSPNGEGVRRGPEPTPFLRIGVAQDNAFNFYYPDNLEALQALGAELVPFSPLTDTHLPDVDGLYLGGGFPEVLMDRLAENEGMRREMKTAVTSGLPIYAECGGLMYLSRSIKWQDKVRPMVGALPCDVEMMPRPQGHGFVRLEATDANPFFQSGSEILGHEFHHSRLINIGEDVQFAYRVLRGNGITGQHDGLIYKNVLAGYAHLHALGAPGWASGFVQTIMKRAAARTRV